MRALIKIILSAWRTLVFVATVLSLIYVWPNIKGLPAAFGSDWEKWGHGMPERATVAYFILGLSLLWIVWMDMRPAVRGWWRTRSQSPLTLIINDMKPHIRVEFIDGERGWVWPLRVKNLSEKTIEGVEVHLLQIVQKRPPVGGSPLNERLGVRGSGATSFTLTPHMTREVAFLRRLQLWRPGMPEDYPDCLEFGPLESTGDFAKRGPGLHKIDLAIYGHDVQPRLESISVALDGGAMMIGPWRDDLPWPFYEQSTLKKSEYQLPQSSPSTAIKTPP